MPDIAELFSALGLPGRFDLSGALGAGPVSDSWLVNGPDGLLVLRRDRPLARALNLDRNAEWRILRMAYAADLGPEPVACDSARGLLVTRYLGGTSWSETLSPDSSSASWSALGAVMRRVHQTPAEGSKAFDPVAVARGYRGATSQARAVALLDQVITLSPVLLLGEESRLCHHDAHCGNVIGVRAPKLIDWEYAARGDPLFDLAVISRFHQLAPEQNRELLAGWGHELADGARFRACCALYDALAALWSLAVNEHSLCPSD